MAEKNQYRSFIGFVKYEPRESDVETSDGEVTVRNIVVREVGVKDQAIDVRATVWPSHADVTIEEGDLIALEGKFTPRKGENKDGEPTTFFNLSVSKLVVLGCDTTANERAAESRSKRASTSAAATAEGGDEDEAW